VTIQECIEQLGDMAPTVRLAAQEALQQELQKWHPHVGVLVILQHAEHVSSERQKRRLGAILGDIATPECVSLLVLSGRNGDNYAGTIARRALRRWFDNAPMEEVSRRILATLQENAEQGGRELTLFLLEYIDKRALQEPHISLWPVAHFLEELERRRLNRHSFFGSFNGISLEGSPYLYTIQLLHSILPPHDLPRPSAENGYHAIDLPRPVGGSEFATDNLPMPAAPPTTQRPLSLREKLFGRRQR
jgi:hypothetical protein